MKRLSFKQRREEAIAMFDFTEAVLEAMKRGNITRTELAERLRVSRPHISQILNGDNNFTFKTALAVARAVGMRLRIELVDVAPEVE